MVENGEMEDGKWMMVDGRGKMDDGILRFWNPAFP